MARHYGVARQLAGKEPAESRKEYVRGVLICVAGVLCLSPESLLVRLIQTDIATLLFLRCLFSASAFFLFLLVVYRRNIWQCIIDIGRPGVIIALVQAVQAATFIIAQHATAVANVLVIIASAPMFAALISRIFLREQVTRSTWAAVFSVFLGILLLFLGNMGQGNLSGDLWALLTAWLIALNFVLIRQAKHVDMIPATALNNLILAAATLFFGASPTAVTTSDFGLLLIVGLLVVPIAMGCLTIGPRYLSAADVSLIMLLETPLGPFWVWLVLNEVPELATIGAGIIILCTLLVHTLVSMKRASHLRKPPEKQDEAASISSFG